MRNKERLLSLAAHLRSLPPGRYDQTRFFGEKGNINQYIIDKPREFLKNCGTAACGAGWTLFLFGDETLNPIKSRQKTAQDLLSLTWDQADKAFDPLPFGAHSSAVTNIEAAMMYEHLAETGRVKWVRHDPTDTDAHRSEEAQSGDADQSPTY